MVKLENTRPGGFGIPGGPVIAGKSILEVEQSDWDTVKDHPVVAAWIKTEHLIVSGEDDDPKPSERDDLKKQAAELGLEYPKNISTEKLKELIDAKLAS
ncbi:hypothetical protein LJR235_002888 [Pararhizobium sp. LjRoot235]|uniref:hypothetical protein n=1 Tax=Pararhizobium sp. LjRoot235 TaxID=3342291 RepID=UPI003ECF5964